MLQVEERGSVHRPNGISKEIFVPSADGIDKGRIRLRGKVVEWSLMNGYVVDRTFSFPHQVLDIAVMDFHGIYGLSVCILARPDRITIIPASGSVIDVPLFFPASAIMGTNQTLLIERVHALHSTNQPLLFSLMHPLEEPSPVTVQRDAIRELEPSNNYVSDPQETLVSIPSASSFAVHYNQARYTYCLKLLQVQDTKSAISSTFGLRQVWESPQVTGQCKLFIATDLSENPIFCIMNTTSQQLLLQQLEGESTQISVNPASEPLIIPCRLACPILRAASRDKFDILVLTLQNSWMVYRGKFPITKICLASLPPSPIVHDLDPTPICQTFEICVEPGKCSRFSIPFNFSNFPLLERIFNTMEFTLPPELCLKWRYAILRTHWNGLLSTLLPPDNQHVLQSPHPTSSFDILMASGIGQKIQQGDPKIFELLSPNAKNFVSHDAGLDPELIRQLQDHLDQIFSSLHLLYEDLKLSMSSSTWIRPLGHLLARLAQAQGLEAYVHHYVHDLGADYLQMEGIPKRNVHELRSDKPPDLLSWIQQRMAIFHHNRLQPTVQTPKNYPTLPHLTRTNHVIDLYDHLYPSRKISRLEERAQQLVHHLVAINHFERFVNELPDGVALPLHYALTICKHEPNNNWDTSVCQVIQRPDWIGKGNYSVKRSEQRQIQLLDTSSMDDGLDDTIEWCKTIFPKDQRLREVQRLVRSNKPMYLKVPKDSSLSDADLINLQQARLLLLCKRSMAMSVARGMVTFGSLSQYSWRVMATPLRVPPIVLEGRIAETNAQTILDTSGYKELTLWPQFHNGVATSLRLPPSSERQISMEWILSHKPKETDKEDDIAAHAGFLLGLGMLGHLNQLTQSSIYQYLSMDHELTSVGILLGLAASTINNKDLAFERTVSRILTLHIPVLLPPTFSHVNITPSAQTASILGLGLLYRSSGNRNITEILLSEVTASPIVMCPTSSQATVDLSQKESYAFVAGIAVGLVNLGRLGDTSLADLHLEEKLGKFMTGGTILSRPDTNNCTLRTRKKSAHLESINVDVTAAGSALALAFIYIQSNHARVVKLLKIPSTIVLLEAIRPDLLFIRVVASNLVAWDQIEPTKEWIEKTQLPSCLNDEHAETSTVLEAYANIYAGACFSIGLKYAGSLDEEAKKTLLHCIKDFNEFRTKGKGKEISRVTWERCLGSITQALAFIMAGSGDLDTFREIRAILLRQKQDSSIDITFGNHMATSSALGILFLGGGRCSLKTTTLAIASLVISFYPLYPMQTADQKYHLQALRHLYVLAIDSSRLVETIDVETGDLNPMAMKIWNRNNFPTTISTPCLLPSFTKLSMVSKEHFSITIDLDDMHSKSNQARIKTLQQSQRIYVKRKLGNLDSPHLTLQQQFHQWFVKDDSSRWGAFCNRIWQECELQQKPTLLCVYLNAKHCEEAVLSQSLSTTLMVTNLQLMYMHMELEAHIFQYEQHAGAFNITQLVNEDFILGYNNSLLLHFSMMENNPENKTSLDESAFVRYHVATQLSSESC